MKNSKMIRLSPAQVKDFVTAATRCDFDVDISYNHFTIDAKSILGVFCLNLNSPLKVSYYGHNQDFENYLMDHMAIG